MWTIGNATGGGVYPYAGCRFVFDITNVGSVPAHFTLVSVVYSNPPGTPLAVPPPWTLSLVSGETSAEDLPECQAIVAAINAHVAGQINVDADHPVQLHQGEDLICVVDVALAQSAQEADRFQVFVTIRSHQWNETTP